MPQLSKEELMLKERKVKALEKIANVLDALTLWFEDIDKEEWSNRMQWYLSETYEKYIKEDKIGKYPNHYYAKFKDGKITEVWKLTCNVVLDILLPKIKKQFDQGTSHKKDPRIGVSVSQKEIKEYGERIR